jgi:hypothetical protein
MPATFKRDMSGNIPGLSTLRIPLASKSLLTCLALLISQFSYAIMLNSASNFKRDMSGNIPGLSTLRIPSASKSLLICLALLSSQFLYHTVLKHINNLYVLKTDILFGP